MEHYMSTDIIITKDTMSIDIVNEDAHNMEHYIQIIKGESQNSEAYSWRSKAFPSP